MSLVQRRSLALDEMGKRLESHRFNRIISNRTLRSCQTYRATRDKGKCREHENGHGDRYQYLDIKLYLM